MTTLNALAATLSTLFLLPLTLILLGIVRYVAYKIKRGEL